VAWMAGVSDAVAGKTATVKIVNQSSWEIHEFYLSPTGPEDEWGPDQLQDKVINAKGGNFTLTSIPCDTYDVKLVDEDQDECEVEKVDICGGKETWTITDKDLVRCQKATEDAD